MGYARFKILSVIIMISIMLFSVNILNAEEVNIEKPETIVLMGKKIEEQSFMTSFKGFGEVEFASYETEEEGVYKVNFYLIKEGKPVYKFPQTYGNKMWGFDNIIAIGFRKLGRHDKKDIIIISEYITGVGPEACVPFKVIDVYFQREGKFTQNRSLNRDLNSQLNYDRLKTVSDVAYYIIVTLAQ